VTVTLQTYITDVQRLLHDTSANFWPTGELTDYINSARHKVSADSKCLRQLATGISLPAAKEVYPVQTTVNTVLTATVIDVMGISVYTGNSRYKLNYMSFTQFDAQLRAWQLLQSRPVAFTRMGATQIYIGPIPDQTYVSDWDVAVLPFTMVNTTDMETIPYPFTSPVKWYAAYLAKFKEQQMGEAELFRNEYNRQGMQAQRSFMTRVIPDPYSW
jgi:hypothetical protein